MKRIEGCLTGDARRNESEVSAEIGREFLAETPDLCGRWWVRISFVMNGDDRWNDANNHRQGFSIGRRGQWAAGERRFGVRILYQKVIRMR